MLSSFVSYINNPREKNSLTYKGNTLAEERTDIQTDTQGFYLIYIKTPFE